MGEIRRIDVNDGPVGGGQVGKGRFLEDLSVVVVESEHAAGVGGGHQAEQVPGAECLEEEGSLNVAVEEFIAEILENPVAEKPVVGCWEGAPGDRTDGVDLVEESHGLAIDLDHRIPEFFEDPIRKGGGSRSATREGQG